MAKNEVPVTGRRVVYTAAAVATFATAWQLAPLWFAAAWAVAAWLWPMAPCWKCKGSKVNAGSGKKRFGPCRRCKGSGTRWAVGAVWLHRQVRQARKQIQRKRKERS